jgi:hypothetical protein
MAKNTLRRRPRVVHVLIHTVEIISMNCLSRHTGDLEYFKLQKIV